MSLQGKGFMIWKIRDCEGGDPTAITNAALSAGLTNVMIKIADGTYSYNIADGIDKASQLVPQLKANGIETWGWHYIYGDDPIGEAQKAASRTQELNLDGYIIDAEMEFKNSGMDEKADEFMTELRRLMPNFPVALTSFRFPTIHPQFPWTNFLSKCDINMPQVYWIYADNPAAQLQRCYEEFQDINPVKPIIPIGPVFKYGDWVPTGAELVEFMDKARTLEMDAVSYFTWDYKTILGDLWTAVSNYNWDGSPPVTGLPAQYIQALNSKNLDHVVALYNSEAVHITAGQTVQGTDAIRQWHYNYLNFTLPGATFSLIESSGSSSSQRFTWQATTQTGQTANGNDTIGILNDKIIYHYTFYTIS